MRVLLPLVGLVVLSGCLTSGGSGGALDGPVSPSGVDVSATPLPTSAERPGFDDETGAILGLVVDVEHVPIPAALVSIADRETFTAADGTFAFSKLPWGRKTLRAQADGFLPATVSVDIKKGTLHDDVLVALEPRSSEVPHSIQFPVQRGILTCGLGYETGEGKEPCKLAAFIDKATFTYHFADRGVVTAFAAELRWTPAIAEATEVLGLRPADRTWCPKAGDAPLETNGEVYTTCRVRGATGLTWQAASLDPTKPIWTWGGEGDFSMAATSITAEPKDLLDGPTAQRAPLLVFQQEVTHYATAFLYGARPPPGFSAAA
jgi:hypothetical protein